jgi:AcrR family transcriptional regulator
MEGTTVDPSATAGEPTPAPPDGGRSGAVPGGRSRTRLSPYVRREQILDAATELFRSGEGPVSLDDVADRAGVTRGLVHHYFGTKRDLFLAVVERSVRIPDDVAVVPPGTAGELPEVARACVAAWMAVIREAGGLWAGGSGAVGFTDPELDAVLDAARDDLVERMVAELPFPPELDRDMLRSALRCYAAMAKVATHEWLATRTLTTAQTAALLETALVTMADSVVPAMSAARSRRSR